MTASPAPHPHDPPDGDLLARLNAHDVEALETLYDRYSGDYPRAMTMIEQTLRMGTRDAELLYRAGRIALASGESERGRSWLDDAASINPYFNSRYNRY